MRKLITAQVNTCTPKQTTFYGLYLNELILSHVYLEKKKKRFVIFDVLNKVLNKIKKTSALPRAPTCSTAVPR